MTTRPRLGENIYAVDRKPLDAPWKPQVTVIPNSRGGSETPANVTASPVEEAKTDEADEDPEYNLLADLLGF